MTEHLERIMRMLGVHYRLVAAALISLNAFYTLAFYRRIAYADQLDLLPLYRSVAEGGAWWREIFVRHGGHWHAGGYSVMLPLARASDWNLLWEAVLSVALLVLSWWILVRMVRPNLAAPAASLVALLTTCLLFSLLHSVNLLWTWQLSLFLSVAATCAAIHALNSLQRSAWFLGGALVATLVAVSSFATGFAIWPVGVFMIAATPGLSTPRKSAMLGSWLLAGAVVAWLFVGGDSATPIVWSDVDPLFLGSFVLSYLGAPLGYFSSRLAPLFGFIGIVAAILLTLRARNLDRGAVARLRPFYGLMFFAAGCAVLSALGRAEFSLDQARSPRYLIFSQLYWIGLLALAGAAAGATAESVMSTRAGPRRAMAVAAAMAIALTFYNSQKIAKRQAVEAMRLNDAITVIRNRYPDVAPGAYELLAYPDKRRARELLAIMHHYQVNLFSN